MTVLAALNLNDQSVIALLSALIGGVAGVLGGAISGPVASLLTARATRKQQLATKVADLSIAAYANYWTALSHRRSGVMDAHQQQVMARVHETKHFAALFASQQVIDALVAFEFEEEGVRSDAERRARILDLAVTMRADLPFLAPVSRESLSKLLFHLGVGT